MGTRIIFDVSGERHRSYYLGEMTLIYLVLAVS